MISNEELDSAVVAGVLDARTAEALRAHVAALHRAPAADEEHFRLIAGFNDIFVVIASALLLVSLYWIGNTLSAWVGAAVTCVGSWGLAEYFVRRRRMALPAIVLLGSFVGAAFATVAALMNGTGLGAGWSAQAAGVVPAVFAVVATWLHWRRFQVPITVAVGAAVLAFGLFMALASVMPDRQGWMVPFLFIAGVAMFALAVRWDASDPTRTTRRSDVAFWLHLTAAPMLVHPVFSALGFSGGEPGVWQVGGASALYVLIGAVSLMLDRRALMVSALGYVLFAFTTLLQQHGFVQLGFAVTALGIGAMLLLLSAFWQRARAVTVRLLPLRARPWLAPVRVV